MLAQHSAKVNIAVVYSTGQRHILLFEGKRVRTRDAFKGTRLASVRLYCWQDATAPRAYLLVASKSSLSLRPLLSPSVFFCHHVTLIVVCGSERNMNMTHDFNKKKKSWWETFSTKSLTLSTIFDIYKNLSNTASRSIITNVASLWYHNNITIDELVLKVPSTLICHFDMRHVHAVPCSVCTAQWVYCERRCSLTDLWEPTAERKTSTASQAVVTVKTEGALFIH